MGDIGFGGHFSFLKTLSDTVNHNDFHFKQTRAKRREFYDLLDRRTILGGTSFSAIAKYNSKIYKRAKILRTDATISSDSIQYQEWFLYSKLISNAISHNDTKSNRIGLPKSDTYSLLDKKILLAKTMFSAIFKNTSRIYNQIKIPKLNTIVFGDRVYNRTRASYPESVNLLDSVYKQSTKRISGAVSLVDSKSLIIYKLADTIFNLGDEISFLVSKTRRAQFIIDDYLYINVGWSIRLSDIIQFGTRIKSQTSKRIIDLMNWSDSYSRILTATRIFEGTLVIAADVYTPEIAKGRKIPAFNTGTFGWVAFNFLSREEKFEQKDTVGVFHVLSPISLSESFRLTDELYNQPDKLLLDTTDFNGSKSFKIFDLISESFSLKAEPKFFIFSIIREQFKPEAQVYKSIDLRALPATLSFSSLSLNKPIKRLTGLIKYEDNFLPVGALPAFNKARFSTSYWNHLDRSEDILLESTKGYYREIVKLETIYLKDIIRLDIPRKFSDQIVLSDKRVLKGLFKAFIGKLVYNDVLDSFVQLSTIKEQIIWTDYIYRRAFKRLKEKLILSDTLRFITEIVSIEKISLEDLFNYQLRESIFRTFGENLIFNDNLVNSVLITFKGQTQVTDYIFLEGIKRLTGQTIFSDALKFFVERLFIAKITPKDLFRYRLGELIFQILNENLVLSDSLDKFVRLTAFKEQVVWLDSVYENVLKSFIGRLTLSDLRFFISRKRFIEGITFNDIISFRRAGRIIFKDTVAFTDKIAPFSIARPIKNELVLQDFLFKGTRKSFKSAARFFDEIRLGMSLVLGDKFVLLDTFGYLQKRILTETIIFDDILRLKSVIYLKNEIILKDLLGLESIFKKLFEETVVLSDVLQSKTKTILAEIVKFSDFMNYCLFPITVSITIETVGSISHIYERLLDIMHSYELILEIMPEFKIRPSASVSYENIGSIEFEYETSEILPEFRKEASASIIYEDVGSIELEYKVYKTY